MFGHFLAVLAAVLVCAMLVWQLRQLLLTPVKAGENTTQLLVLCVRGREPALENHVAGLLWLNDSGVLRCRILIRGTGLDEETRLVAQALERDHSCVTFVENGETAEWISRMNL